MGQLQSYTETHTKLKLFLLQKGINKTGKTDSIKGTQFSFNERNTIVDAHLLLFYERILKIILTCQWGFERICSKSRCMGCCKYNLPYECERAHRGQRFGQACSGQYDTPQLCAYWPVFVWRSHPPWRTSDKFGLAWPFHSPSTHAALQYPLKCPLALYLCGTVIHHIPLQLSSRLYTAVFLRMTYERWPGPVNRF